jgi:DNA-binding CsgD family transcriptional regulator
MSGIDESVRNVCALGFLELSLSQPRPALKHLAAVAEITAAVEDPGMLRYAADHIEALVGVGDLTAAETHLMRLERQGRELDRTWALAVAARCRGLLLGAEGAFHEASEVLNQALEHHTRVPMPFEHARTVLVAGIIARRARCNTDARHTLTEARSIFERLGAPLWAAKATAALARIGGRAPAPEALTATEKDVAKLVAAGCTNPEVAAKLYISRRTVEDHLTKIYRKLNVRSRTELAHRLGAHTPGSP